jgi:predicted PolB exonuclease-like 3'-5' exonuclease
MGISLQTYKTQTLKRLITEVLYEIFDSTPLQTIFTIILSEEGYSTENFKDEEDNLIRVIFHNIGNEMYELDFTVNGSSFSNPELKYTTKQYSKLLHTVAKAVSQFLHQINPKGLQIDGADSFSKILKRKEADGQKNFIYDYFILKIENDEDYKIDRLAGGNFNLIRK